MKIQLKQKKKVRAEITSIQSLCLECSVFPNQDTFAFILAFKSLDGNTECTMNLQFFNLNKTYYGKYSFFILLFFLFLNFIHYKRYNTLTEL